MNQNSSYRGKFRLRETKFSSSKQGIWVISSSNYRVKMTEKCGQIQGKWDFVPVGGGARVTGDQL